MVAAAAARKSDIVISSRIRLARNLAAFPFTNRASAHQKSEIETLLRDRIAKLDLDPAARLPQRRRARPARSPVPRRTPTDQPRTRRGRGPRGVAFGRKETVSVMVNEEDHLRLQVIRSGFSLDEAWQEIDRVDDARAARDLRIQRGVRLPDRLPHQRRHGHARQRHAAPARPGLDQADRKSVPRLAENQSGGARPLWRRQPGFRRLLPDLQPGHARQERDRHSRRNPRGHSARSSNTSVRPVRRWLRDNARGCRTASRELTARSARRR